MQSDLKANGLAKFQPRVASTAGKVKTRWTLKVFDCCWNSFRVQDCYGTHPRVEATLGFP
jgi:hypothetical protein